jgi:FlgD Ig-like domain
MPNSLASIVTKVRNSLSTPLRRLAVLGSVLAALTLSAVLSASHGPELNILLYPLPTSNYDSALRVSGLAEPNQVLQVRVGGQTVANTRANESGDFVAVLRLAKGENSIQIIGDNGRFSHQSLSDIYRVRQVETARSTVSMRVSASRMKSSQSSDEFSSARGGFSIQSATAPVLTAPAATSTSNPITISGSAQASSTVSFYVNGRFTREVVAATDGTFSTWVPLEDGLNSIYATATADRTGASPASNTVQVTYTNSIPRTYAASTISQNTVWTAGSAPTYTLNGTLTIAPGATLWIQPGVNVSMTGYYRFIAQGGFVVRGSVASRTVFRPSTTSCTATSTSRQDWFGVEVTSTGNADIEYGDFHCAADAVYFNSGSGSIKYTRFFGNSTAVWTKGGATAPLINGQNEIRGGTYGIYVDDNSRPVVSGDNLITANNYGIYVNGNSNAAQNPIPVVNGNGIYGNAQYNYYATNFGNAVSVVLDAKLNWWGTADPAAISLTIRAYSATATSAAHVDYSGFLGAAGGAPAYTGRTVVGPITQTSTLAVADHLVLGDIIVNPGVTLTIPPEAFLRFVPGSKFLVNGALQAAGTSSQRVRFGSASAYPAKGDWYGIEVATGGTANLDYARIEHATNGVYFNAGQGTVAHSLIRFCQYGIYVGAKSSPTIHLGNQISHNDYGIYVRGNSNAADNPQPIANGNSLFANAQYNYYTALFATPKPTLDATGNWWGTAVAANIPLTIDTGAASSTTVNYGGYLSAEPVPQAILLTGFSMSTPQVKPLITTVPAAGVFTINRSGTVTYRVIRDADGATVREWTQAYTAPGQYTFNWNGFSDQGVAVAGGIYRVVLTASDGVDPFVLDAAPVGNNPGFIGGSAPSTYNPYMNEFYKANVDISQALLLSLQVTPQSGTTFYVFRDVYYPAGSHWVYWDGRAPDGLLFNATSRVWTDDGKLVRANGVYVFTPAITITGTGAAPNIEVKSDPYLVNHSYDQSSQIVYRIDADALIRVSLLPFGVVDPSHPSAIVLVDNVAQSAKDGNGNPIDHVAEWRGYNVAGDLNAVPVATDGAYTFAIEATLPANGQKTVYRGILNLRQ